MAYKVKVQLPCESCGTPTNRRIRKRRCPQCLECSIKAVEVNAVDQHYHRGEAYQRWLAAVVAGIDRGSRATGTSVKLLDVNTLD